MPPLSWRCQIFLLLIYNIYWLLVPAGCIFDSLGSLTVEPPVPFLMGSDLTLYCNIDNCMPMPNVYLEIKESKEILMPGDFVNCTAIFTLTNFRAAQSYVYCKKNDPGTDYYVTGITLRSGIPPDQAQNISCETTRSAHFIDCRWNSTETHVPTSYSITIKKENGFLAYSQEFHDKKNCSIPRELFDDNMKYQLSITARNHFGKSRSDPLTFSLEDVVIPETPHITQIDVRNKSMDAFLRWNTSEFSENLKPFIRRRATNGDWGEEVSELSDGLVKVTGLRPLTDYEFQVKTCIKPVQQTDANPRTVTKIVCSKWSLSFLKRTPGKVPSLPVFVWRHSVMTSTNGQQMVTVFWKPPPADDFSGKIHWYEIFFGDGQKQKDFCASLRHCSARVRLLRPISVTAVTSYGTSPPAMVPLAQSDAPGPVWRAETPAIDGSSLTVSWARPEQDDQLMNYVTEWTTVPPKALHWQTVSRDQRGATITGLEPGVLYNVSIFAVTTRGVSIPSSSLVYSKELEPMYGPVMSVLVHESNRALVQWDELHVKQRRGFITSYTIYYKVLDSSSPQLSVSVPVGGPREQWLDCPDGTLALQMSASNAAGEGPKGNHISSNPPAPQDTQTLEARWVKCLAQGHNDSVPLQPPTFSTIAHSRSPFLNKDITFPGRVFQIGLVIVIIFIITLFIAIIVNLMCWKCVRKRIKQRCIAWGPAWLGDNLPKPKNSYAIKLLQLEGSEPSLCSSYIDPPLSPITLLSGDNREEQYPCVHVEPRPLQTDPTSLVPESTADGYKPQTHVFSFAEKADVQRIEEEKSSSDLFEGLSNVRGDLSGSQMGPGLDAVNCPWWSKTSDMNIATVELSTCTDKVDTVSLMDSDVSAEDALVDFSDNDEGTLAGGYFPQLFSPVGLM